MNERLDSPQTYSLELRFEGNQLIIDLPPLNEQNGLIFKIEPEFLDSPAFRNVLGGLGLHLARVGILNEVVDALESYNENGLKPVGYKEYALSRVGAVLRDYGSGSQEHIATG